MQAGARRSTSAATPCSPPAGFEEIPHRFRRPPVRLVPAGRPTLRPRGVIAPSDAVVAAGVEVMSLVPMGASIGSGVDFPFGAATTPRRRRAHRRPQGPGGPGVSADHRQRSGSVPRDLDAYGARSPGAGRAGDRRGPLRDEIIPVVSRSRQGRARSGARRHGHRRRGASAPAPPPRDWPSSSRRSCPGQGDRRQRSQICDGASAALIMRR